MRLSAVTNELKGQPLPATPNGDSLDERIAAAFVERPSGDEIAALLVDCRAEDEQSQADHIAASERALDPATPPAEVQAARRVMEDASFRRNRLSVATRRLGELLEAARRDEDAARRQARVADVTVRRDAMVVELRKRYPGLVNDLADLLHRLSVVDREAAALGMVTAEQMARHGEVSVHRMAPPLARCKLVDFERSPDGYLWADHPQSYTGRKAKALPTGAPSQAPIAGPQYVDVPTLKVKVENTTRGQPMLFYSAGNSQVRVAPGETVEAIIAEDTLAKVQENFRVTVLGPGEPARRVAR